MNSSYSSIPRPNQEAHIKGCDALAEYLEGGDEYDKFEDYESFLEL